jgi:hypothetical protein
MSITPFLRNQAFDPETVEVMAKAFATTCEALGLTDRTDAMTELVAQKIIEFAQRGLKNPFALHVAAMQEFEPDENSAGPVLAAKLLA